MIDSVLDSVKKNLGIADDYTVFDEDLILHINSVFSTLNQIGVGPAEGFQIEDAAAVWFDFLGDDPRLNHIKTYMFLRVKFLFDPPTTSFHLNAIREQYQELEWRLSVQREETAWVPPGTNPLTIDGGSAIGG